MKGKRHQPPKSGDVGITIVASGKQLPMRCCNQGDVASIFDRQDPDATCRSWSRFLSDTLQVSEDLFLHDVHMVKRGDEGRVLNLQDLRELSDPELGELILYFETASYSGPDPPCPLPKAGKRRAPGACIIEHDRAGSHSERKQNGSSRAEDRSSHHPTTGITRAASGTHTSGNTDALGPWLHHGLTRQDSCNSVASSDRPPSSPRRSRSNSRVTSSPTSSPVRRSTAYAMRQPPVPADPCPPSPAPSTRRPNVASPARPLLSKPHTSPARVTRTTASLGQHAEQDGHMKLEQEGEPSGPKARPRGEQHVSSVSAHSPSASPSRLRTATSAEEQGERRGRKRARGQQGAWEEGEGDEEGEEEGREAMTSSPSKGRTRLLTTLRSNVAEGASRSSVGGSSQGGSVGTSSAASTSGKSSGASDDGAGGENSNGNGNGDEKGSEARVIQGELAGSLKQEAIARRFCSAGNKKLANEIVDRANRILANFLAGSKAVKRQGLALADTRARASFFLKHRDRLYYMTEQMDDNKKLLDTFRLLFYWGMGDEPDGRREVCWMPDAVRDKVLEKERRMAEKQGKKP